MKQSEKISFDDAVKLIMKRTGKTRRQATAELNKSLRAGKLPAFVEDDKGTVTTVPKSAFPLNLSPDAAVKAFDADPSSLVMMLNDIVRPGGLTPEEVLGELRSGRLIACGQDIADPQTGLYGTQIVVGMDRVVEWITNPETPPQLVAKFKDSLTRKPH
jgi:hypothetical protein